MVGTKIFLCAVALGFTVLVSAEMDIIDQMSKNVEVAYRLKMAIKATKQISDSGIIQQTVRTNFLNTLHSMANASVLAGTEASRSAGLVIRGFVQDSFNLGSLGAYMPRLILLDGPSQFIEVLRLIRTNQIRIPMDLDTAMDTLINFASSVRASPTVGNVANPFFSFFPNVFRGTEVLAGDVLYNVFAWLAPLSPTDVSLGATNILGNRWDVTTSTLRP